MDKNNVFFPGYARCVTCQNLVSDKEARDHILNCRPKTSREKINCSLCNQLIDTETLKQHMETCKSSNNNSNSHSDDDENDTGFQTPRAQTPTQVYLFHLFNYNFNHFL